MNSDNRIYLFSKIISLTLSYLGHYVTYEHDVLVSC